MLGKGDKAPDFSLEDASGVKHGLKDFKGRKIVLYFYPKDDTPGCTTEACGFRDQHGAIEDRGAIVIGVSPDKPASHVKFAEKYNLPFLLLADPEHSLIEAFGAWGEKKMYGKSFMGVIRSTFIIDEKGKIAAAWPKVSPEGHAEEVLSALAET